MAYDAGTTTGGSQGAGGYNAGDYSAGGYGTGDASASYGAAAYPSGSGYLAADQPVQIRFTGGALPMIGRLIVAIICSVLIIPAAWGIVPYIRWLVESLEWSDGTRARFEARPGEVWHLFALAALVGLAPALVPLPEDFLPNMLASLGIAIVTAGLSAAIAVPLWRYYTRNTRIGQVDDLTFDGDVPTYAAFTVGVQLAIYTIVGWAWVTAAMQRWIMSHIRSRHVRFEFHGSGLSILWRTLVFALACMFIIPIPWAMRWLVAWFVAQTVMYRKSAPQPPMA